MHCLTLMSPNKKRGTISSCCSRRIKGKDGQGPRIQVLNEDWGRNISFDAETGDWVIEKHTMCFGDVNIWVLPKDEL